MDSGILESLTGLTTDHGLYAADLKRLRVELIDPVPGLPQPLDHSLSTAAPNAPDVTEAHRRLRGGEQRTPRIAARFANGWNVCGTPQVLIHEQSVLDAHCRDIHRDPAEIQRSPCVLQWRPSTRRIAAA